MHFLSDRLTIRLSNQAESNRIQLCSLIKGIHYSIIIIVNVVIVITITIFIVVVVIIVPIFIVSPTSTSPGPTTRGHYIQGWSVIIVTIARTVVDGIVDVAICDALSIASFDRGTDS